MTQARHHNPNRYWCNQHSRVRLRGWFDWFPACHQHQPQHCMGPWGKEGHLTVEEKRKKSSLDLMTRLCVTMMRKMMMRNIRRRRAQCRERLLFV